MDPSGRSYARRGTGQAGYFDESQIPEYNKPSIKRRTSSNARQRPPPMGDRMTAEPLSYEGVSPELIAAITEKVKKEVVEHLKQTGSLDDPVRPPPMQRIPSNRSNSTSSPPLATGRVYTPPSPPVGRPTNTYPSNADSRRSPPGSPLERPSGLRFSERNLPTRPAGGRTYSTMELSTIDQKWGRLFDNEGSPTLRLGQFLRGLANHLIDDFQPQKSIVVVPEKMATLYANHALEKEVHPFVSIFRAQNNELISELYQDLCCEHHLVQGEHASMAPTVPALTPVGFERWMTINIMAYPEEESKRLQTMVLAMPVNADGAVIDGKPERLPKQISRHLLPEREDPKAKKSLDTAIRDFLDNLGKPSRRKKSITSPPISRHSSTSQPRPRPDDNYTEKKTSPTPAKVQPLERERNPYAGGPSAADTASGEESVRIERERQPYTAQPGNGKVYPVPGSEAHHHRTGSSTSSGYMPPPRRSRRTSSPPLRGFRHSTPDDINVGSRYAYEPSAPFNAPQPFAPSSFGSPGSFPPPPPPMDIRRDDRYRRATEDEIRLSPEFNSPRDAERWDRFQESQAERPYERGNVPMDPPMNPSMRGAAYEDWYREKGRAPGYDPYTRY